MSPTHTLALASLLFCIGVYGLLTRKQAVAMLLSVELMANAANIVFLTFGQPVLVLFALAITVAEVAVGLALIVLLYRRHGDTRLSLASEARQ